MNARRRPWGAAAAAASIAFALTVSAVPLTATAAHGTNVPTPQEIAAAKRSEAAKQAEIAKIGSLLKQFQRQADEAARDAQTKGAQYTTAQLNLDAATAKASDLAAQQKAAQKTADASAQRAAAIIAQLARTGGGDVTMGLVAGSGRQTDQLLQRLGSMNHLSASAQGLVEKAEYDRNAAASLAKQASVARAKRAALAETAKDALATAQDAATAANTNVTAVEASQSTLYTQLADLKGTTADLERQAAQGVLNPPPPSGSSGASGGGGTGGSTGGSSGSSGSSGGSAGGSGSGSGGGAPGGVDPTPPAPSSSAVTTAIAFAKAQLGKPYANSGGIGPNVWDCSGLTMKAYQAAGIGIGGWGSNLQYNSMRNNGRLVDIRSHAIQPGDLLFYADGGNPNISNYHVAMAIGGGQMIEAPYEPLSVRIVAIRSFDLVPYAGRPTG
jgi:cell wall-associated NlpC family hydrolase